ncbi:TonB-dependent receptor [Arcobacter lacus]|uniref:TonB-dependent receptor n=1 Tax=Arcobacter lacus TaxID=1912876 RepID=UPI0021BA8527|nr:TonB-dependent receptor [Arcobacter lacus]MCT7908549.1 TonB-dependent receptor [Arcobacter lacus]
MLINKKLLVLSLFVSSLIFANETTKLKEITVSANKMEENIKDVPQSITVVTEVDIEQKGIKNIQDVIKEVPNAQIDNVGFFTFRGLSYSTFTNTNPMVIYLDGVPYSSYYDFNPSLANVEQIEVLRGPQGTLYGKDAIGGVINIVTKEPTNEWKGSIGAEYGNDNYMQTILNTSGALIDNKLFAGINGSYKADDGYITNTYPNQKKDANEKYDRKASGFLLWKPTDNFKAKLTIADNKEKKNLDDSFVVSSSKSLNDVTRDDAKNVELDVENYIKSTVESQALNLTYDFDNLKLDSITTHKESDAKIKQDGYFTVNDGSYAFNNNNIDGYTQEFKLSSKNQNIKWVTGLYFNKDDIKNNTGVNYSIPYLIDLNSKQKNETQAIFGQTMIPLGESFELTLGGRYQKIKKDIDLVSNSSMMGMNFPSFNYSDEKTWNSFLPKAALTYKISDNLSTYISVSKGYMPGGFNVNAQQGGTNENSYEPQKSTNYEVGAKYIGDNFALNTAIFRMEIEDIHVFKYLTPTEVVTSNAKKAHSQGIEFDGSYFITDDFSIQGSLGIIDAKYDDYDNGTKYDGKRIDRTPKYTANLSFSYLPIDGFYGRVDFNARGKTNFFDGANKSMVEADGAIITNTKIGYKIGDFDIYAFAKNLTNEDYITYYLSTTGTDYWAKLNDPRQFGIGAIYKF